MRRLSLLLTLMALSACSATPWARLGSSIEADRLARKADAQARVRLASSIEADRLVRQADAQARAGNPQETTRILESVVRRFPDAPVHDRALYDLARALVLAANGVPEYRQASAYLDRLLREHPTSAHAPDAQALRAVLGAYVAREAELERLLERLKAIDFEFERRRQP